MGRAGLSDVSHHQYNHISWRRCLKMVLSLQKYGFSQERCLRALAFTGFRTVRLAAFWLCSHINDPILALDTVQDFFVLMCLEGELSARLSDFLYDARHILDWSSTLDAPPSVAVLHFEACSVTTPEIHRILQSSTDYIRLLFSNFNPSLEFSASSDPCFVGYCFRDPSSGILLDELSKTLSDALIGTDTNVRILSEVDTKKTTATNSVPQFPPLTLAQAFPQDQLPTLLDLHDACSANISIATPPQWSIRLYSRDPRLRVPDPEVYEMLTTVECDSLSYSEQRASTALTLLLDGAPADNLSADHHSPTDLSASPRIKGNTEPHNSPTLYSKPNGTVNTADAQLHSGDKQFFPLAHQAGDYVLLLSSCVMPGRQGCPLGLNLNTGLTGVFNLMAGRRVPQYVTWALHGSIPVRTQSESVSVHRKSPHQIIVNQSCSQLPSESERCDEQLLTSVSPERCRQPSQMSTVSSPAFKLKDSPKGSGHSTAVTNGRHFSSSSTSTNSSLSSTSCPGSRCFAPSSDAPWFADRVGALWAPSCSSVPNPLTYTQACAPSSLSGPSGPDFSASSQYFDSNSVHPNGCTSVDMAQIGPLRQGSRPKPRQLFVMRHAERVDICFGRGWITRCFDKKGVYRRFNLNLPPWLPPRGDYLDYTLDSPITQVGLFVSAETGRSLAEAGVHFTACYSSPSFRCVQTACELLRAMGRGDMMVRIEPHLFEWLGWYSNCMPRMMSPQELHSCGYSVDVDYRPLSSQDCFDTSESISSYYERSGSLTKRLLALHKSKDVCILIVAHASSLDACTHQLVHHGFRTCITPEEFHRRTTGVPYCAMVVAEGHRRWTLVDPPVPAVCSYAQNPDFDWKQLMNGTTLCGFRIR